MSPRAQGKSYIKVSLTVVWAGKPEAAHAFAGWPCFDCWVAWFELFTEGCQRSRRQRLALAIAEPLVPLIWTCYIQDSTRKLAPRLKLQRGCLHQAQVVLLTFGLEADRRINRTSTVQLLHTSIPSRLITPWVRLLSRAWAASGPCCADCRFCPHWCPGQKHLEIETSVPDYASHQKTQKQSPEQLHREAGRKATNIPEPSSMWLTGKPSLRCHEARCCL